MTKSGYLPLLALAGVCLLPIGSYAAISFGIGPKAGINIADASVANHDTTDHRVGFAAGVVAEFGVTKPWSLQLEPMYVQRGTRFDVPFAHVKADLDYLEIPLMVKAKFGKTKAHAYAIAGPSMGINLTADGDFGSFGSGTFKDDFATVTWSGEGGVGGAYEVRPFTYLQADVRYTFGISDALDHKVGDIDSWAARDIRIMVGVLFHLTE